MRCHKSDVACPQTEKILDLKIDMGKINNVGSRTRRPLTGSKQAQALFQGKCNVTEEKGPAQSGFDQLASLPLLSRYEDAFHQATGVEFQLVPPDKKHLCLNAENSKGSICSMVGETALGSKGCAAEQKKLIGKVDNSLSPLRNRCFAGLSEVVVPVLNGRRHVGTLVSSHIFEKERSNLDFEMLAKRLGKGSSKDWKAKAKRAYFKTQVVPSEKFEAITELLHVFARHLQEDATRHSMTHTEMEHIAVRNAKKFILSHYDASISLEQVLKHVHVSRFHFFKIFKKATGMTMTEYTSRVRVEKAKSLLLEPGLRISDVIFTSGFGSIPQFNAVFKRHTGMSPTAYRTSMRTQ